MVKSYRHLWYPCSQMKDYEKSPPLEISRGKGVYLYDKKGKAYFDAISSWWVNLFGHSNPKLNKALCRQVERLEHVIFAGCTHEPAAELSATLIEAAPKGLEKVFFADNGSSAVEVALKMSFQYWKQTSGTRITFIALSGGYHGETIGALSVGGIHLYRKVYEPLLMNVKYADAPSCTKCPFGLDKKSCNAECFSSLEKIVDKEKKNSVAAVIVEPLVQCANGMNMYPPVYLKKLKQLCVRRNIHLIADEIAVGFGRTGRLFACEHAGISPDFMTLSKGITGGYMPFAAVLTGKNVYNAFYGDYSEGKAFLHSHSYTGNPLACALAVEVQRIFRENGFWESLAIRIRKMENVLSEISTMRAVRGVRQTGFIGAFDLVNPSNGRPFPKSLRAGRKAALQLIKRGQFMRPLGDTLYIMPPLVTTEAVLESWKNAVFDVVGSIS